MFKAACIQYTKCKTQTNSLKYAHDQSVICQSGNITKGIILPYGVLDKFRKDNVKMFIFTKSSLILSKMHCLQILGKHMSLGCVSKLTV